MASIPGPSSPALIQTWRWLREPYEFLEECAQRYGEIFTFVISGFGRVVVCSAPERIKEIFAGSPDDFLGGKSNEVLRPFVGENSLLVLDGAPHHRQRKLLMPSLHGERMQAYGRAMLDFASASIDAWPLHQPFPIHSEMQSITLRVILRTIFGVGKGPMFERMCQVTKVGVDLASNPLLLFSFMQHELGGLTPWGKFMRMSRELDAMIKTEVDKRQQAAAAGQTGDGEDVLAMLLQARDDQGEPMTFQELRDELVTMLVAGHETTATTLAWTLGYLLREPALVARLKEEAATAIEGGQLQPERVNKLPLLEATIKEGMRLRPVAPMTGRLLKKPIKVGEYDVPAGCVVAPGIYLAHRRPSVFPEPDRFDPDRFLRARPGPNEWLPFGGGNRRCIGAAFATYEMKMVLATLVLRTTLSLQPGYELRTIRRGVTMAPAKGVPVILSERRPLPGA